MEHAELLGDGTDQDFLQENRPTSVDMKQPVWETVELLQVCKDYRISTMLYADKQNGRVIKHLEFLKEAKKKTSGRRTYGHYRNMTYTRQKLHKHRRKRLENVIATLKGTIKIFWPLIIWMLMEKTATDNPHLANCLVSQFRPSPGQGIVVFIVFYTTLFQANVH